MNYHPYFPVAIFIVVSTMLGLFLMVIGRLISKNKPYEQKLSPYECGFEPFGDARMQFDVRYNLIAILFIIFDVEVALLFPWAISQHLLSFSGFITMISFIMILIVGFIYELKKGALTWE